MSSLRQAILSTLTYSDHFSFPLTSSEVHHRLISHSASLSLVRLELKNLVERGDLGGSGGFYFLPGREKLVSSRKRRRQLSAISYSRASVLAAKLGNFPGVLAVYLTGSLAVANSEGRDDIDFMIVTRNGALWTVRALLTILTTLLGLRRTPSSVDNAGKLCLNLYLTPAFFALPVSKRSLYTAYELVQAVSLYDPFLTRARLLAANDWIHDFLPNSPLPVTKRSRALPSAPMLLNPIEKLAYLFQRIYMSSKLTREYVTSGSAFFHPADPGKKVLKKLSL